MNIPEDNKEFLQRAVAASIPPDDEVTVLAKAAIKDAQKMLTADLLHIYAEQGVAASVAIELEFVEAISRSILTDREARSVIPAGYKLVPVEPTEEMIRAADKVGVLSSASKAAYRAMLAASPSPSREETEGEKEELAEINAALKTINDTCLALQYDDRGRYGVETIGPLRDVAKLVNKLVFQQASHKPDTSALLLEAEMALEPFAEHASEYDEESDQQQVWPTFEIEAFRAARSTLSKIRGRG